MTDYSQDCTILSCDQKTFGTIWAERFIVIVDVNIGGAIFGNYAYYVRIMRGGIIKDLHYIDYAKRTVVAVPYTRDRAMSVSPVFYPMRRAALTVLMQYLQEIVHEAAARYVEIKKEIENE